MKLSFNFNVDESLKLGIERVRDILGFEYGDGISVSAVLGERVGVSLKGGKAVIYYSAKHQFFRELGILCECPVPVKIIIMNNRALGMVDNMEIGKGGKYLLGDTPDFSLLAKAYNVPAQRTGLSSETADLVEAFLSDGESGLLEIIY